jgi:fibro-slime domain-containing protein
MPKPRFPFLAVLLLILGAGAGDAQPQQPTDSLGGKTIHVFLPTRAIDILLIQNFNQRMTRDSRYWYSYTITHAGLYDYQDGFYFTDPSHRLFFSKSGFGATEAPRFMLADFQGKQEMWIIVDPTGPATAAPAILTQAPRIVNILNPWPMTAPKLIAGSKSRNMTTVSGHCGWFSAMLLDTVMTGGHFSEVGNTDIYGKGGLGNANDFDFAPLFAQYGSTLWLNTQTNTWSGAFPNVEGTCQYMLAMTVRDFGAVHPDFDFGSLTGEHPVKGAVQPVLGPGPGRKPVLNAANAGKDPAISFGRFDDWWNTDSTRTSPLQNYESCYDLPMGKSDDGSWEYESFYDSPDHGFWPVEGAGLNRFGDSQASCYAYPPPDSTRWVTGGPKRNGNFCAESHADFVYVPGQRFAFRGDDDVWIFINGKLVVDLGGVHVPKSDSIDLDKLGLTPGQAYKWDFFYCDRQPCGSALRIKTSIYFRQQRSLFGISVPGPTPGSIAVEIRKRVGGTGSCSPAGDTALEVPAANLVYQLIDAAGQVIKDLSNPGTFYNGGITIAEPVITIDTAKLVPGSDLAPGAAYRVVAFEPANQRVRVEVAFRISSPTGIPQRRGKAATLSGRRAPYRNALGRRVPELPGRAHAPLMPRKKPGLATGPD